MIRTRSPDRTTEPSTIASTPSSEAICRKGFRLPLSCMTEVRETTRKSGMCASSVINASVMPSAKYSWLGFPERFCSGKTASERMGSATFGRRPKCHSAVPATAAMTAMPKAAVMRNFAERMGSR